MPASPQPAYVIWGRRLIIVSGEEGAGKSTIVRALLPSTPQRLVLLGSDAAPIAESERPLVVPIARVLARR